MSKRKGGQIIMLEPRYETAKNAFEKIIDTYESKIDEVEALNTDLKDEIERLNESIFDLGVELKEMRK